MVNLIMKVKKEDIKMESYKIIRYYRWTPEKNEVIKTGLTLEEAQEHCQDETTHEKNREGKVIWFDGYDKE